MPTYDPENLATAAFAGPGILDFPFKDAGDITTKLVSQSFFQLSGSYAPLAFDTAYSASANFGGSPPTIGSAYCVGETTPQLGEAGVVEFMRFWANIPAARSRAAGTYSFRFPGLPNGLVGSPAAITAMSPSSSAGGFAYSPVFTSAAHGFAVGDRLYLTLNYTAGLRIVTVNVTAVTTNTFTTTDIWLYAGSGGDIGTFSSGTASELILARSARTIPADSIEVFSYALPGVTSGIATSADFRPDVIFEPVVTATGESTDTLSASTTPTADEYRAQIEAGSYVVAESGIRIWRGNILERRTVMVRCT